MDNRIDIAFLEEEICKEVISYIVEDEKIEYDVALDRFYSSETFKKLNDDETALYLEGSAYVYHLLKQEITLGHFPHV